MALYVHTQAHVPAHTHTHMRMHARTHTHTLYMPEKAGAREQQKDAHFGYELLGHCRLYQAVSKSQSVSVKIFIF